MAKQSQFQDTAEGSISKHVALVVFLAVRLPRSKQTAPSPSSSSSSSSSPSACIAVPVSESVDDMSSGGIVRLAADSGKDIIRAFQMLASTTPVKSMIEAGLRAGRRGLTAPSWWAWPDCA